jgi:hypothetical protein
VRDGGWRRIAIIALIVVVVLGAAAGGLLWWRAVAHSKSVRAYKSHATASWNEISTRAKLLTASMLRAASPADLAGIATEAYAMQKEVSDAAAGLKKSPAPSGYKNAGAKESTALASVDSYLQSLGDIASAEDPAQLQNDRSTLEDKARKAQDDVNDFLSADLWLKVSINNDFYQAGSTLQAAFEPPDPARDAEEQAVYDAANAFMNADISQHNFDVIWSMLSSRLRTGFDYYKVKKDTLAAGWDRAWGGKPRLGYFISRSSIQFPSPGHATVRAIAYIDHGPVRIEEIQLVNEGSWKIDSYPFAGWYGP